MTSTMRPMSSSAGLRTSRPSTPCASFGAMTVTEGGGAASFAVAAGGVAAGCASFSARKATAVAENRRRPRTTTQRVARMCTPVTGNASMREHDRHLDLPAPAQHFHRHAFAMTRDPEVDARIRQLQIAQDDFVEERRQMRIAQPDLGALGIEFEPERRLQQRERRRAGPGLRRTGHGIERWPAVPLAAE